LDKFLKNAGVLVLAVIFCLSAMLVPVSAATTTVTGDGGFTFDKSTGTITKYNGDAVNLEIPSSIDGVTVIGIGDFAFCGCTDIDSVTISSRIVDIGENPFQDCTSLADIEVDGDNQVYSSKDGVLFSKNMTKLILYPEGKTQDSYTVPDGVASIGTEAFYGCQNLVSVTLPDGLKDLGNLTFYSCESLKSIDIPDSVASIDTGVFCGCKNLESAKIPDSVVNIGSGVFLGCTSLASIDIPDSVTTIGQKAFFRCDNLKTVEIPDSVTSIEENAFADAAADIEVSGGNANYTSKDGVLFNKDMTTLIQYPVGKDGTGYTIPDGVTSIGKEAFFYCAGLKSVTMPDSVTTIGQSAFGYCSGLETVSIPSGVAQIGFWAFADCTGISYITIPGNVTDIGSCAFEDCTGLSSVTIEDGVKIIESTAFYGCTALDEIELPASISHLDTMALAGIETVSVDSDNEKYSSSDGVLFNKDMTTLIQYKSGSTLTSYYIPDTVTDIANAAFENSKNLKSVTISDSVATISDYAFYGCTGLESITIPASVKTVGQAAFAGCTKLTGISVDDGSQDFSSNDGVLFNKNKTTLLQYPAGMGNSDYKVPDGVRTIGKSAFDGCTNLVDVIIGNDVEIIESGVFIGCINLKYVTMPTSVECIWYSVFDSDNSVTLYVTSGSYAETYAQTNDINYIVNT
jgi:hypothetical protein